MTPLFNIYLVFALAIVILSIVFLISRYLLRLNDTVSKEKFFYNFSIPGFRPNYSKDESDSEKSADEDPEIKIFQNALEFSKLKVRDCMVPRNEIVALDVTSNLNELREKFIESGYSKILVYDVNIDNIIGYISSKELYKSPESIRSILVSLSIVPESMQINKLLSILIKERRSIALVVDEYGGTSGIVTLEDIMEEIFGEIEDEHDTQEFIERQVNDSVFILSGRLEIDYLNEKYKLNIPETEDYDTLAGFVIFHYANIPKLNTRVIVNDLHMRILKVSQTRIELVRIERIISKD
jgi:putative hemolysin